MMKHQRTSYAKFFRMLATVLKKRQQNSHVPARAINAFDTLRIIFLNDTN